MIPPEDQVARALSWLRDAQLTTGEIPSFASALDQGPPQWIPDQLNFITALTILAIARIDHPDANHIADLGVRFLREEREGPGLWRYWSRSNEKAHFTPPDADDTACCSMALGTQGRRTARNRAVLLDTAAADGRFHTWLLPRGQGGSLRTWWSLRDERRPATRAMRHDLWNTTEADPDDIDAVVNANVCRYLGPNAAPRAARWVASVATEGTTSGDKWHRSPFALWAAVADGSRRGVEEFSHVGPIIVEQIRAAIRTDGTVGTSYETGLALAALVDLAAPAEHRNLLAEGLRSQQGDDGAWPRDLCYHGGPREVFGWASEALTTAVAIGALSGHAATDSRRCSP